MITTRSPLRKLRLREVQEHVCSHTATKCSSKGWHPDPAGKKAGAFRHHTLLPVQLERGFFMPLTTRESKRTLFGSQVLGAGGLAISGHITGF